MPLYWKKYYVESKMDPWTYLFPCKIQKLLQELLVWQNDLMGKAPDAMYDDLSPILWLTWRKERNDSWKLSSDLHLCLLACVCPLPNNTHILNN